MYLQRFTNIPGRVASGLLLLAALLLAACSSTGPAVRDDARATGNAALTRGEDGAMQVSPAAQTLFEQAAATMASGDLLDAELRFKELLLQYPDIPAAQVNLAIIHSSNGNDEAARAAIDAALQIDPDFAPALNQLGMLLRRNGNFPEAEAAYLKAVTVSPEYALAHYNLGVLNELYLQRLDIALQHFEQYQALVGDDEQVEKWIADLERRVAANQRTANVAE
ncbi:MAG TPA: tetratricopeptide repeat protein [Woeseiaceae bacterium]|nr:tetratricopeptide repeat protein [Woeseiaceae bacterium]